MLDVAIIVPTRARAGNVRQLIDTVTATTTAGTHLILAIDDDDTTYDEMDLRPAKVIRGPRRDVVAWTNDIAVRVAGDYRLLASLGDDHRPRTPGWVQKMLAALGGRPGVAYGDDLHRGAALATAPVVSSAIVAALGYLAPAELTHLCLDLFAMQVGADLDHLVYLPDVVIEHCHHSAGKAPWDEGYARANAPEMYAHDNAAYGRFLAGRWPDDLTRLKEALGS